MFDSILTSTLTPVNFFVCLGVAMILGLIVALTHQKTARSSANFTTTLAVLPMLVAMAIMLVNGNLGAGVATVGVFSLVRFRSIAGNSRSILSVFFAMAIGLACGTGYITFAALFTVLISLVLFALKAIRFGETTREQQLKIMMPEDLDYTNLFDDIFGAYTSRFELIKAKTTNMGSLFELTYRINLKGNVNEKQFIDKIRVKNGNLKVCLSHDLEEEEL
ncbi:MAG: DUF4956 domain-containing protein [Candidatus Saccharibacteria bacterium]|nr:DUF4956 domain-containing protein [Candidatus Saccharibacteria bacterium]